MKEVLTRGLEQLSLPASLAPVLEQFAALLLEKNRVMNLTAITEPEQVATLHFLDSLALTQILDFSGRRVVDVGTGAGFPGIPLRAAVPDMELTLLDSLGKRVLFLQDCCAALKLEHITCVHARAEEFAADHRESYDIAVSRAVAALPVLCELCLPLVQVGGRFLAMKSVDSDAEIQNAEKAIRILGGRLSKIQDYTVPETAVVHRAVIVEKCSPTPAKYPRIFAKIKKSPL